MSKKGTTYQIKSKRLVSAADKQALDDLFMSLEYPGPDDPFLIVVDVNTERLAKLLIKDLKKNFSNLVQAKDLAPTGENLAGLFSRWEHSGKIIVLDLFHLEKLYFEKMAARLFLYRDEIMRRGLQLLILIPPLMRQVIANQTPDFLNVAGFSCSLKDMKATRDKDFSDSGFDPSLSKLNKRPGFPEILHLAQKALNASKLEEADQLYTSAWEMATSDPKCRQYQADILQGLGKVSFQQGKFEEAKKFYKNSLKLNSRNRDLLGEARTYSGLGEVYRAEDKPQQAKKFYQRALNLLRPFEADDRGERARLENNIGQILLDNNALNEALVHFNKAKERSQQSSDARQLAQSLINIGKVKVQLEVFDQALQYFRTALGIFKAENDPIGLGTAFNAIGKVYLEKGELDEALQYFQKALTIDRKVKYPYGEAELLNNISEVYREKGSREKALHYQQSALKILQQLK